VVVVEYFEVVAWSPLNYKPNLGCMAYMDQKFGKRQVLGYSKVKYHQLGYLGSLSQD